jgi:hypothetical protein
MHSNDLGQLRGSEAGTDLESSRRFFFSVRADYTKGRAQLISPAKNLLREFTANQHANRGREGQMRQ